MHVPYDANTSVDWDLVFDQQVVQQGGGGFRGYPYQRGASGLGGLFSKLLSLVLPIAKRATRAIGTEALETTGRIVDDLSSGRNFGESIREHGPRAYHKLVSRAVEKLNQQGSGRKASKRKTSAKKKPAKPKNCANKRKTTTTKASPPAKRRKVTHNDIFGKWAG